MALLTYIFSLLNLACKMGASLVKGKRMRLVLLLSFTGNVFLALSYTFAGRGINGAASCYLGCALTLVSWFFADGKRKQPRWLPYVYEVLFVAVNLIFGTEPLLTAIAIAATVSFVISIIRSTGAQYRFWTAVNQATWLIFDLVSGSYGSMISHITLLSSTLLGIFLHDRKKVEA